MKEWPVLSHLVMKSAIRFPDDIILMAIGYKYIYQNILGFISMEGKVSTVPGVTYLSCYPENCYNVSI